MSSLSWVRAGAKCVLVGNFDHNLIYPFEILPKKATIYTVRDIVRTEDPSLVRGSNINNPFYIGITLVEIKNLIYKYSNGIEELKFDATAFRPVVVKTEEEDIAMFNTISSLAFLRSNLENEVM